MMIEEPVSRPPSPVCFTPRSVIATESILRLVKFKPIEIG